jgi:4-diphosphocytidyl-2-C-methyl-D-erythritol kinase
MELKSFAKINLGLRVHGRLETGYHLISTVFQTISLHDSLFFEPAEDIFFECDDSSIPTDGGNLVVKSAEMLRKRFGYVGGARIKLRKRIPSPGGLGGGSSNAAVTLLGLSSLWKLQAGFADLVELAREMGADVPFFLLGGTAKGCKRGDEVAPLTDISPGHILVMTPHFGISTAEAVSGLERPFLTSDGAQSILRVCRSSSEPVLEGNDFEDWAFESFPELAEMAERLKQNGASSVSLSGSGSSIFAVFEKEETRQATINALNYSNWRMFAVATVTRSEYRDAFSKCEGLFPISF